MRASKIVLALAVVLGFAMSGVAAAEASTESASISGVDYRCWTGCVKRCDVKCGNDSNCNKKCDNECDRMCRRDPIRP
ncbi:hypothetical protein H9P43_005845 [Blastocladiella emersonii ATCC 22665]|nr:hypothetical protein H9P43_005845 [Blastocladiella emersonii ATCC 22665]